MSALDNGANVHLVTLSNGNYDGLGHVRSEEMRTACRSLQISQDKCVIVDSEALQDGPSMWPETAIHAVLDQYVPQWGIDTLISFDTYGVSGHPNHASLGRALISYKGDVRKFAVQSSRLVLKYTSFFLLPYTLLRTKLMSAFLFVSKPHHVYMTLVALSKHRSQYAWYRYLNIMFSHYMWYSQVNCV